MRINPYKNKCEQSRVSMKDCNNNNNNIIIITDIGDQNFIGEKYNPKQQLPIFLCQKYSSTLASSRLIILLVKKS
jgi:hypothetical protein